MGSIGFEFDLLFHCPDYEVFSVLAGGTVGAHQEAFVGGELGVDGVGVAQQAFVLERVAVVELHSFLAADSQVGPLRGKHSLVDLETKLLAAPFEGRLCTFVEVVQPLEVKSFVFSDQELVPELFVDVVFPQTLGRGVLRLSEFGGDGLVLFLDECSDFVDPDAAHGVGGVELEIIEFAVCGFGLRDGLVGEVQGSIAVGSFDSDCEFNESIFLSNVPACEEFLFEQFDKFFLLFELDGGQPAD